MLYGAVMAPPSQLSFSNYTIHFIILLMLLIFLGFASTLNAITQLHFFPPDVERWSLQSQQEFSEHMENWNRSDISTFSTLLQRKSVSVHIITLNMSIPHLIVYFIHTKTHIQSNWNYSEEELYSEYSSQNNVKYNLKKVTCIVFQKTVFTFSYKSETLNFKFV